MFLKTQNTCGQEKTAGISYLEEEIQCPQAVFGVHEKGDVPH